jgi:phosphate transport system substrate-binding protein
VWREKIAIIVGANNPFSDGLTTEQFVKIFQGEITDWSELGNGKGKIRFIDRPSSSDTRSAFGEYSVFEPGELRTGANAVQMLEDNTTDIIKELGNDGIGYVLANQVSQLEDVRVLKVQNYLPDNSKYPFSQSFVYVYKENPSSKVRDFLGFILAQPGEKSIKAGREAEAVAIAASTLQTISTPVTDSATTPIATTTDSQSPLLETTPPNQEESKLVNPFQNPSMITKNMRFFLLLPLFLIAVLSSFLPLWLRRRKRQEEAQLYPNIESDSISNAIITSPDSQIFTSIVTNNHNGNGNGNGTNNHKKQDFQEITPITNIAVIDMPKDMPKTNSPNSQIKEIPQIDPEDSEAFWDTEDPVIVVNSHFPAIPNIRHNPINADIPTDKLSNSLLEPPEPPANISNRNITSLSELLGITSTPIKEDSSLLEVLDTFPSQSDSTLSELLNTDSKSDEQPPENEDIPSNLSSELELDQPLQNEDISYKLPSELGEALKSISNQIVEDISPTPLHPTPTDEAIAMELDAEIEAWTNSNTSNVDGNTRIIFTPRTPKWAYLSWYISDNHQQTLQSGEYTTLAIRLYDVTNLDLSYQRPQFVQQYECETAIYDRYIPIPRGERDYITEIGYLSNDNRWLCLARSGMVRIFSRPSTDFWFVVDAELVLHGATEEGANVTIDGQKVKVNADGTFKLTVPFVDNLVDYHLTATSDNKENTKTIDKKFFQEQKES